MLRSHGRRSGIRSGGGVLLLMKLGGSHSVDLDVGSRRGRRSVEGDVRGPQLETTDAPCSRYERGMDARICTHSLRSYHRRRGRPARSHSLSHSRCPPNRRVLALPFCLYTSPVQLAATPPDLLPRRPRAPALSRGGRHQLRLSFSTLKRRPPPGSRAGGGIASPAHWMGGFSAPRTASRTPDPDPRLTGSSRAPASWLGRRARPAEPPRRS